MATKKIAKPADVLANYRFSPRLTNPTALFSESEIRRTAFYIINQRDIAGKTMQQWHDEIRKVNAFLDGDMSAAGFGPQTEAGIKLAESGEQLRVQNLALDSLHDGTRLAAESLPGVTFPVIGDGEQRQKSADIASAIALGYSEINNDQDWDERYYQDLLISGWASQLHYVDQESLYPCHQRLDPRGCFPNVYEGKLIDLMFSKYIQVIQAEELLEDAGFNRADIDLGLGDSTSWCEVLQFFSGKHLVKCLRISNLRGTDKQPIEEIMGYMISDNPNVIGTPPISWAKTTVHDDQFKGNLYQTINVNATLNTIVTYILDNMEKAVYAPLVHKGLINPDQDGPNAELELDTGVEGAMATRLPPAPISPQVMNFYEMMEMGARGSSGYPKSRESVVPNSIASGTFVSASQGQETTNVRALQRRRGEMIRRSIQVDFALDKVDSRLNIAKPLLVAAGNATSYTPSKNIPATPVIKVKFGLGSGMPSQDRGLFLTQLGATKMISKRTVRENLPDVDNPLAEETRIYDEIADDFLAQKALATSTPEAGIAFADALADGKDIRTAFRLSLVAEQSAQAAQQQQQVPGGPGQLGTPGPPGTPEGVANQALALSKGGLPGSSPNMPAQQGPVPSFSPPPSATTIVNPR